MKVGADQFVVKFRRMQMIEYCRLLCFSGCHPTISGNWVILNKRSYWMHERCENTSRGKITHIQFHNSGYPIIQIIFCSGMLLHKDMLKWLSRYQAFQCRLHIRNITLTMEQMRWSFNGTHSCSRAYIMLFGENSFVPLLFLFHVEAFKIYVLSTF